MGCETMPDLIQALIDGEINAADEARLQAHLQTCAQCRTRLSNERRLNAQIASLAEEPPAGMTAEIMRRIAAEPRKKRPSHFWGGMAVAAAAALLLLVGAGYLLPSRDKVAYDTAPEPLAEQRMTTQIADAAPDTQEFARAPEADATKRVEKQADAVLVLYGCAPEEIPELAELAPDRVDGDTSDLTGLAEWGTVQQAAEADAADCAVYRYTLPVSVLQQLRQEYGETYAAASEFADGAASGLLVLLVPQPE